MKLFSFYSTFNNTDSQKKVEVSARERIQSFMLAIGNLIITPQKNQNSVVGGKTFFCPLKRCHVLREEGSIIKLVAFEAENYLEYMCQISLSWDNGLRRH